MNECDYGESKCIRNDLIVCEDFDNDGCTEWGFEENCYFKDTKNTYFDCEENNLLEYQEIEEGFCKDVFGYNDYCSSYTYTEKINEENCYFKEKGDYYFICENEDSIKYQEIEEGFCKEIENKNDYCSSYTYTEKLKEVDCGVSTTETEEYCKNNDVYVSEISIERGCEDSTGYCYEERVEDDYKVEECGESFSDEYCNNGNIVFEEKTGLCVEQGESAFCDIEQEKTIIEECGPDTCIEFTERDPYVLEYV